MKDHDLTAGPATPLVLTALAEGETYGYAILKRVRELSGGSLDWSDGMLYPLLHRLRRLGYVTADWRAVPEGHRRRYYWLTPTRRGSSQVSSREAASSTRSTEGGPMLISPIPSPAWGLALAVSANSIGGGR